MVLAASTAMLHNLKTCEINGPENVDLKVMGRLDWGYDEIMSWMHKAQREERASSLMFATEEGAHFNFNLPMGTAPMPEQASAQAALTCQFLSGKLENNSATMAQACVYSSSHA